MNYKDLFLGQVVRFNSTMGIRYKGICLIITRLGISSISNRSYVILRYCRNLEGLNIVIHDEWLLWDNEIDTMLEV